MVKPAWWRRRSVFLLTGVLVLLIGAALVIGPVIRAIDLGNFDHALTDSLNGPHTGQDALTGWSRLGTTMAALQDADHGQIAEIDTRITQKLRPMLAGPSGRQAVFTTDTALNGQILALPPPHSSGLFLALDVSAAPPIKVYFINGILTTNAEATEDALYLRGVLGQPVNLIYNHSLRNPKDYSAEICMRDLGRSVKAGMLCQIGDKVQTLSEAALGVAQLIGQEMSIDAASSPVSAQLLSQAESDLHSGTAVILIGHSQGTLFAQAILKQLNNWWASHSSTCATVGAAPAAALYISPAFVPPANAPNAAENYVALRGDVLHALKIGPAGTADPSRIQEGDALALHSLYTYLQPGSDSRQQIESRFRDLAAYASSRIQCKGGPSPTISAPPTITPSPTITPAPIPPNPAPAPGARTPIEAVQALSSAVCRSSPSFSISTGCPITTRLQDRLSALLNTSGPGAFDPICRCQNTADVTYTETSNNGDRAQVTVTYHFSPPQDITWSVLQLRGSWYVDDSYCSSDTSTSFYGSFGPCNVSPPPPPPGGSLDGSWSGSYTDTGGASSGDCPGVNFTDTGIMTMTVTTDNGTFSGSGMLDTWTYYDRTTCQRISTSPQSGNVTGTLSGGTVQGQLSFVGRRFTATLNGTTLSGTFYNDAGQSTGSFSLQRR